MFAMRDDPAPARRHRRPRICDRAGPDRPRRTASGCWANGTSGLFFSGYATSLVGAAMVPVALTFAVLQEHRPASDVGYVLAAETVPLVVLLLVGGIVADRFSRRTVMLDGRRGTVRQRTAARRAGDHRLTPRCGCSWCWPGSSAPGRRSSTPRSPVYCPLVASPEAPPAGERAEEESQPPPGEIVGPAAAGLIVAERWSGLGHRGSTAPPTPSARSCLSPAAPARPVVRRPSGSPSPSSCPAGWTEFRGPHLAVGDRPHQFGLYHLLVYAPFMVLGAVVAEQTPRRGHGLVTHPHRTGRRSHRRRARGSPRPGRADLWSNATIGTFAFTGTVALLALRRAQRGDRRRRCGLRSRYRRLQHAVGHHLATTHSGRGAVPG